MGSSLNRECQLEQLVLSQPPQADDDDPSSRRWGLVCWKLVACYLANLIGLGGIAIPLLFTYCGQFLATALLASFGAMMCVVLQRQLSVFKLPPPPGMAQTPDLKTAEAGLQSEQEETPAAATELVPLRAEVAQVEWSFNLLAKLAIGSWAAALLDLSVATSVLLVGSYFLKIVVQCVTTAAQQIHGSDFQSSGGWWTSPAFITSTLGILTGVLSIRPKLLDHHFFSVIAAVSIVGIVVVLVTILAIQGPTTDRSDPWVHADVGNILQCVPVFIAVFSVAYNSPVIMWESARAWMRSEDDALNRISTRCTESTFVAAAEYAEKLSLQHRHSQRATPPEGFWRRARRSLTLTIVLVVLVNLSTGLLGTFAIGKSDILHGGGNIVASLPAPPISSGDPVSYPTTILRLLVALHVTTVFPVYATTGRQAFLRTVYPRGLTLLPIQLGLNAVFTVGAILLSLYSPTVGLLLGLNCAVFAPPIALFIPAFAAHKLLLRSGSSRTASLAFLALVTFIAANALVWGTYFWIANSF